MKKTLKFTAAICASSVLAFVSASNATVYSDSTGENFTAAGGGILDITSVEVSNSATDLIFKISLAGNPGSPTDWGKYLIGIDSASGGDTAGNGWGRPISMSSGMNHWIGSWVDGGNGVQVFSYSDTWSMVAADGPFAGPGGTPATFPGLSIAKDSSSVTITTPFSLFGLTLGSSFDFDIYTSGGGGTDGAVDALGNPNQTINDWGVSYDSGANVVSYTLVPEPSIYALGGLGALLLAGRAFRRRA